MPLLADLRDELLTCLGFYTRLPLPAFGPAPRGFAAAQWAAPVAGLVVAIAGWLVWQAAHTLGVPPWPSAALALAVILFVTGCLHEDGLADTMDGFGGGRTRERALDIMRDSRIGTYGAAALTLSILFRWSVLAGLQGSADVFAALVAAHMASRALIPTFMASLTPARLDGLSASAGPADTGSALAAAALGAAALLFLGIGAAVAAVIGLAALFFAFRSICRTKIGGQTGDTIGAVQQLGEIAVLVVAAAALGHPPPL